MNDYRLGERALAWYLSSITGFIDAIGFMYLGGYFLSFMSGNTTRFTTAAAQGHWGVVGTALGLMGLFLLGVMIGAAIQRIGVRHWPVGRAREAVLAFVCGATLVSSLMVALGHDHGAVLALSFAVGAMNSVFERGGEVSISLTYMTGTLVKMAQRLTDTFFGGAHALWIHHALLWLSLAAGATLGGIIYEAIGVRTVWVVALLVCSGSAAAFLNRQRRRAAGLPL